MERLNIMMFINKFMCFLTGHKYQRYGENFIYKIHFLKCKRCKKDIEVSESDLDKIKCYGYHEHTFISKQKVKLFNWFMKKPKRKRLFYKLYLWKYIH